MELPAPCAKTMVPATAPFKVESLRARRCSKDGAAKEDIARGGCDGKRGA